MFEKAHFGSKKKNAHLYVVYADIFMLMEVHWSDSVLEQSRVIRDFGLILCFGCLKWVGTIQAVGKYDCMSEENGFELGFAYWQL